MHYNGCLAAIILVTLAALAFLAIFWTTKKDAASRAVALRSKFSVELNPRIGANDENRGAQVPVEIIISDEDALSSTEFWRDLSEMQSVEVVVVETAFPADVGASGSRKLPKVTDLIIDHPDVGSDDRVAWLIEKFPNLRSLSVSNAGADRDFDAICRLPLLERLVFYNCGVAGHKVECLGENVLELSFFNCPVDATGIEAVLDLSRRSDRSILTVESSLSVPRDEVEFASDASGVIVATPEWSFVRLGKRH